MHLLARTISVWTLYSQTRFFFPPEFVVFLVMLRKQAWENMDSRAYGNLVEKAKYGSGCVCNVHLTPAQRVKSETTNNAKIALNKTNQYAPV